MEGEYLKSGDLALMRSYRDRDYGYDYGCRRHSGAATTGIGLAAGLGGGALLLAIAAAWGVNQASKARQEGLVLLAQNNAQSIQAIGNRMAEERNSREAWERMEMPSIRQYVDVQTTQQQGQLSSASALALALAQQNGGLNSAIGTDSFLRVQRYSAPQPCGCDSCGCNG